MTLNLSCASEVIILLNKRVIALLYHFFLLYVHIAEIGQKVRNTITSRPPVPCTSQILTTFNLYFDRARMSL